MSKAPRRDLMVFMCINLLLVCLGECQGSSQFET